MMASTKDSTKSIRFEADVLEKFQALKDLEGSKNNSEFLQKLLDCYQLFNGSICDEKPQNFFPNMSAKDREEKEPILKEMFDLEPQDSVLISECELLKKASEYSGKSIEELSLEGRVLIAKNEIGRQLQYRLGRGKKGLGDENIATTYKILQESGQKITVNRLTQRSGSNRSTVERWLKDNNITLE
jgi:hypothetical protein